MLSRRCKGFDVALCGCWSGILLTLFAVLNPSAGVSEVMDRNLNQQYPPPSELDLLPLNGSGRNDDFPVRSPRANTYATMTDNRPYILLGDPFTADQYRQLEVTPDRLRAAQLMLESSTEMTLRTRFRQFPDNTGHLMTLHVDSARFELISHGNKSEISADFYNGSMVRRNTFPLSSAAVVADNQWHDLSVVVKSTGLVLLRFDCNDTAFIKVKPETLTLLKTRKLSMWFGHGNPNDARSRQLKGALGEVTVTNLSNAYPSHCYNPVNVVQVKPASMEVAVWKEDAIPASIQRQFDLIIRQQQLLANQNRDLIRQQQILTEQNRVLRDDHERLREIVLAMGDQIRSECTGYDGTRRRNNEQWVEDCLQCTCSGGSLACRDVDCGGNCTTGPTVPGSCCPPCKPVCQYMGGEYEEGERWLSFPRLDECVECLCSNGTPHCQRSKVKTACPDLTCPEFEQVVLPGTCCRTCRPRHVICGNETCDMGGYCHDHETVNQRCLCGKGFVGKGTVCQDIDECQTLGKQCGAHALCVNTIGSYHCECMPGFNSSHKQSRQVLCRDVDECKAKSDRCHANANCFNTEGSYKCQCLDGYDGDGFDCTPRCDPECQNGGTCIGKNLCACNGGYTGPECNVDVDECRTVNISRCQDDSVHANMPGSYFCKCLDGFAPVNESSRHPICQDFVECKTGDHRCPPLSRCQNSINGSYYCVCEAAQRSCEFNCSSRNSFYLGNSTLDQGEELKCETGIWRCRPMPCDSRIHTDCQILTNCSRQYVTNASSHAKFAWFQDCLRCQCLSGKILCRVISCPPAPRNILVLLPESCCPVCPGSKGTQESTGNSSLNATHRKHISPIRFGCGTKLTGTLLCPWTGFVCLKRVTARKAETVV